MKLFFISLWLFDLIFKIGGGQKVVIFYSYSRGFKVPHIFFNFSKGGDKSRTQCEVHEAHTKIQKLSV
jgi:hypothetical protein